MTDKAKHKRVSMVLTVRVPDDVSPAMARREVRNWINANGLMSVAGIWTAPRNGSVQLTHGGSIMRTVNKIDEAFRRHIAVGGDSRAGNPNALPMPEPIGESGWVVPRGQEITIAEANRQIEAWREAFPEIRKKWRDVEYDTDD